MFNLIILFIPYDSNKNNTVLKVPYVYLCEGKLTDKLGGLSSDKIQSFEIIDNTLMSLCTP